MEHSPHHNVRRRSREGSGYLGVVACLLAFIEGGCLPFPHYEIDQRAASGVVVLSGAPAPGLTVETCSYSSWQTAPSNPDGCLAHDVLVTGPDGSFQIPERRHFEWFIFGEAELPVTMLAVCTADRLQVAGVKLGFDATPPAGWQIPLSPKGRAAPILVGSGRATASGVMEWMASRCN